jgi:hypothetical protein
MIVYSRCCGTYFKASDRYFQQLKDSKIVQKRKALYAWEVYSALIQLKKKTFYTYTGFGVGNNE